MPPFFPSAKALRCSWILQIAMRRVRGVPLSLRERAGVRGSCKGSRIEQRNLLRVPLTPTLSRRERGIARRWLPGICRSPVVARKSISPLRARKTMMAELIVQRVANRRQRRAFVNFPWTLYRGDPNWIPPLLDSQNELVGYRRHPFYAAERRADFPGVSRRGGLRADRGDPQPGAQRPLRRAPRLLRLLRLPRRPGGGRRPVRRRAAVVRRPGHPPAPRADQPVAELRDWAC